MTSDARRAADDLPTRVYVAPTPTPTPGSGTGPGTGPGSFPGGSGPGGNPSQNPFGSSSTTTSPPTASPSSDQTIGAIPPYALTSANGGYVWPVVLIAGLGLLVFGTLLSLALGLASRHGAKKALAAAGEASGSGPPDPESG
jgi:hypothetical protein